MASNSGYYIDEKFDGVVFFFHEIERLEERHRSLLSSGTQAYNGNDAHTSRIFGHCLAAFVSNLKATRNYIQESCKHSVGDCARKWEKKSRRGRPALYAMSQLRNVDIHHQAINLSVGNEMIVGANGNDVAYVSPTSFFPEKLREMERLRSKTDAIAILVKRPIVEIAKEAVNELYALILEGRKLGHLPES